MKKSLKSSLFICLSAMTALASCSDNDSNEPNVKNEEPAQYSITLSAPQQKVLNQSNDFAFDVLKAVNNENGNVFVSPYSLGQALAMLANGAEGETYDEIADVLKIGDGTALNDINGYYATMNKALKCIKCSSKIAIANSLWINSKLNHKILDSYKADMQSNFDAMVSALDFSDAKAVGTINDWSKKHTAGLIPTIINNNIGNESAMLLNTLYFKGLWSYFPKKNTYDDIFRNQFDRNEKVKMMKSDECALNGFVTDEELMVEFDYGGKAFQLQVIMPKKEKINEYINDLDGEKYAELLTYMRNSQSVVAMPKFTATYNNALAAPLQKMGIKRAFGPDAQFSKISATERLSVTNALQNTIIEVNEEGATAASTTRVDIGATSPGPSVLPKSFNIDHPFIYLIRERQTGAILFVGKVQSMEGMQ